MKLFKLVGLKSVFLPVDSPVVYLQALLCGECWLAVLAREWFQSQVDEHVLFEVWLLGELFEALGAGVLLTPVVHLLDVPTESVLWAEDELAVNTVQLLRLLMDLQEVLQFWYFHIQNSPNSKKSYFTGWLIVSIKLQDLAVFISTYCNMQ